MKWAPGTDDTGQLGSGSDCNHQHWSGYIKSYIQVFIRSKLYLPSDQCYTFIRKILEFSKIRTQGLYLALSGIRYRYAPTDLNALKIRQEIPGVRIVLDCLQIFYFLCCRSFVRLSAIFTRGQFWPLGIVVACVCLCVRVCVYQS